MKPMAKKIAKEETELGNEQEVSAKTKEEFINAGFEEQSIGNTTTLLVRRVSPDVIELLKLIAGRVPKKNAKKLL